ncbi:MAG: DMT family transporter [Firmicutes bacterium]|jgi:drug/metabolite transporter (DMT)-like permease|nr:DMT family transporter [Bacillota bacterium]
MQLQKGYFYLYLAALIWGSLGVFARLSGMPPVELAFYRLFLAGLFLSCFLPRGKRLATGGLRSYLLNCGAGVLFAVDCLCFFHALRLTTLSNTVFPYNMQPVFMMMLSRLFAGEKNTPGSMRFVCVALFGLVLLFLPSFVTASLADILGLGLSLAGSFCLAVAALIARRLTVSALVFVYYEIVVAALCLVPFMQHYAAFPLSGYLWAAVIGMVHTVFAYICYYQGLRTVKPAQATAIILFTPVIAALCGYLFFRESVSLFTLAGGAIITANGICTVAAKEKS